MSVAAPRVLAPTTRRRVAPHALLGPPRVLRALAFGGLGLYGALAWARLVAPTSRPALLTMAALAAALGALLARGLGGRVSRRWTVAAVGGGALALVGVLVAAGAPGRSFAPAHWGELARGIGDGLGALPGATTPYRGADPWARTVLEAGGGILLVLGAVAWALLPPRSLVRDRALAALPLLALAGVPAVVLPDQDVRVGVVLLVLLLAALGAEDVRRAEARAAGALALLAVVAGALGGMALDSRTPWVPYQHLAETLVPGRMLTFDWNHSYGPLNWSRDGEEVLRVHMARPVYLKARDLDDFDGRGWTSLPVAQGFGPDVAAPPDRPRGRGTETLRVEVRSLRTRDVVGSGALLSVSRSPVGVLAGSSPGTLVASRPLRRGDAYLARVWAPRPRLSELRAPGPYPIWAPAFRTLRLPLDRGIARDVTFPAFGAPAHPLTAAHVGASLDATAEIARSPYGRMYRLARSLAASSPDPATFVTRVRDRLRDGDLTYAEDVPAHRWPLPAFLFTDGRGYCQQFSGAMALLLRMGGIPARVATGFTPGTRDPASGDWIVRDVNAHSWVEAWFPRWGWVTFDPTPPSAPARLGPAATNSLGGTARRGDVPLSGRRGVAVAPAGGGPPWGAVIAGALLVLAALALVGRRRRRGRRPTPVEELAGALRTCAASDLSGLTLVGLERRLAASEPASRYVRALRETRFAGAPDGPPGDGRRALRTELARGTGVAGTLRALRALPPRP